MEKVEYIPTPRAGFPEGPRHVKSLKQLYQVPVSPSVKNPELKLKDDILFTPLIPQQRLVVVPRCAQQQFSFIPIQQSNNIPERKPSLYDKEELQPHQRANLQQKYQYNQLNLPKCDLLSPEQRQKQHQHMYEKSLDESKQRELLFPAQRNNNTHLSHKDAMQPFDREFGHQDHQHFDHAVSNLDKSGCKFY